MTKSPDRTGVFRKVSVEMYADDRFLALTPVQPSGRSLWLHLITGPHTCPIPGLSKIGQAALAEELNWTMKEFREAFAEVFREGMAKADWESRVMWLPNAIRHNLPQSPNVVRSWAKHWRSIPDCALKIEAHGILRVAVIALDIKGLGFAEAFDESLPKPSRKTSGKTYPRSSGNQEQEQEQEQDKEESPPPPVEIEARESPPPVPQAVAVDPIANAFEDAWDAYPRKRRGDKQQGLKAYRSAFGRYPDLEPTTVLMSILTYAECDEVKRGYAAGFTVYMNQAGWTKDYSAPRPNGGNGKGNGSSFYTAYQTAFDRMAPAAPQRPYEPDDIDRDLGIGEPR